MPEKEIVNKMKENEEEHSSDGNDSASANPSPTHGLEECMERMQIALALRPKHPLQNEWTLWYFKNDRTKDWTQNQKKVITFSTVEDFWSMFNHIEKVSKLGNGCDYSLFKEGIKPEWEDPSNTTGGKWWFQIAKQYRERSLDNLWLELLMCLIGEGFGEQGNIVNGAVVNVRPKGDKISIWLADSVDSKTIMSVGQGVKNRLQLNHQADKMSFEVHKDTMSKQSSNIKAKFVI